METGPPKWFGPTSMAVWGLLSVILAVTVMAQWFLWFVVTSQVFAPWGMVLGVAVAAAQILALFGRKREPAEASCPLPEA